MTPEAQDTRQQASGESTDESGDRTSRSLSLTTGGLTLLGVLLSIGVTAGTSFGGPWWGGVLIGIGTTVLLALGVKAATSSGRGPLARVANWVIGRPDD